MDFNALKPYIPEIINELKENFENNEAIKKFFHNPNEIDNLIKSTAELIETLLFEYKSYSNEEIEKTSFKLSEKYIEQGFPYIPFIWCMDSVRNSLLIKNAHLGEEFLDRLNEKFEKIKKFIAKAYITHELKRFSLPSIQNSFNKSLYSAEYKWFERIREAILSEDYQKAFLVINTDCELTKLINKLSYKMMCYHSSFCNFIKKEHELVHEIAANFVYLMSQKEYVLAHVVLSDLKESINSLLKRIENLYILFLANAENTFFKFVENIAYTPEEKSLILINIRKLHMINETYGRNIGDKLLKEIEKTLIKFTEEKDNLAYVRGITGDFMVLCVKPENEFSQQLANLAEKNIEDNIESLLGFKPQISLSGLKLMPFMNISEDDLRRVLYFLKSEAKSKEAHVFIETKEELMDIIETLNQRFRNIKFIQKALEEKKIDVFFQPIIGFHQNGYLFAIEALARIISENKAIPAGIFIDLIYELDFITKLDSLVLEKIVNYKETIKELTHRVCINISPRSLKSENFIIQLNKSCQALLASGITPIIELTEQVFIENIEYLKKLKKEHPVKFAVDDFGSGYSSLKTIAELTEDDFILLLKIDGSLIKDITKSDKMRNIVKIIANIARTFNVKTVAEFVENKDIVSLLKEIGIDYLQGYYISPPESISSLLFKKREGNIVNSF